MQITGDIVISADAGAFVDATAFVYLEDVGRAGASAQRVGVARLDGVAHVGGAEGRIPFVVAGSDMPVTGSVAVRVHISRDGSEDIASGDFVSTTHIEADPGASVDVPVRET